MNVLLTGGSGFIGSNLVRLLLSERPDWRIVNLDKLTYAGNAENLADLAGNSRYRFVRVQDRLITTEATDAVEGEAMGHPFKVRVTVRATPLP